MTRLFALLTFPLLLFAIFWTLLAAPAAGGGTIVYTDTGQQLGNAITNGLAAGDFDGDGDLDFYAANNGADLLWLNDGAGLFTTTAQSLTSLPSYQANSGDVDGDGDLDVIVGHVDGITLWLNDGSGSFTAGSQVIGTPNQPYTEPLLADLDGDGDLDLFLARNGPNEVWLNQGGVFTSTNQILGEFPTHDAAAADMDGDGDLDIVTANGDQFTPTAPNVVWRNDGSGTFSFATSFAQLTAYRVALLDLDQDGDVDVYVPSFNTIFDTLWLNNGSGGLAQSTQTLSPGGNTSAAAADMDGDGWTDVLLGRDFGSGNEVWSNQSGTLVNSGAALDTARTWHIIADDLNGDGQPDLLFGNFGPNTVWLAGSGTPPTPTHTPTPSQTPPPSPTPSPTPPTPAPAGELGWHTDIGVSAGAAGRGLDMTLDGAGVHHFSHLEVNYGDVEYARWDGVAWSRELITTTSYAGAGADTRLAVAGDGAVHVLFQNEIETIAYAARGANGWQFPGDLAGQSIADLIVDAADRPVLAFENDSSRLAVARWTGSSWLSDEIDTQLLDNVSAALVAGPGGTLYLAYVADSPGNEIRLATFDGSSWSVEPVVANQNLDGGEVALVLDGANRPVILYTTDLISQSVHLATDDGSGGWSDQQIYAGSGTPAEPSLAYDSQGVLHVLFRLNNRPYYDADSDGWQFNPLPGDETITRLAPLAVDSRDYPRFGFNDATYVNLNLQFYGPTWDTHVLEASDSARLPAIGHVDRQVDVAYYSLVNQELRTLERSPGAWIPRPVAALSLPGAASSLRLDRRGGDQLAYRDPVNQRLMYARWNGVNWQSEVVDAGGDVGEDNTLINLYDAIYIVYWDSDNRRVKIARRDAITWLVFGNSATPPLGTAAGQPRAVLVGNTIYVTYYDDLGRDLRLATFNVDTLTWTDGLLVGANSDISPDSAVTLVDGNRIHAAYHDDTANRLMLAVRAPGSGAWTSELVAAGVSGVRGLSLASRSFAGPDSLRIAYVDTGAGAIIAAAQVDGAWQFETVQDGDPFLTEPYLAVAERPYLAYAAVGSSGLTFATRAPFRLQRGMTYNPYNPGDGGDPNNFLANVCAFLLDSFFELRAPRPLAPTEIADDFDIMEQMTYVFAGTPEGRRYIQLYADHVEEMVAIGAADPQLLWDSYQVLQDFMPGLRAMVTGDGAEVAVTQRMVDNALDVWQRLAAAGSPALAAAINAELAASNNLQNFVDGSFDDWAVSIGVVPPAHEIYLPVAPAGP